MANTVAVHIQSLIRKSLYMYYIIDVCKKKIEKNLRWYHFLAKYMKLRNQNTLHTTLYI